MPNINYDYIESYLKGLYIEKDPFLANIEEYGLRKIFQSLKRNL